VCATAPGGGDEVGQEGLDAAVRKRDRHLVGGHAGDGADIEFRHPDPGARHRTAPTFLCGPRQQNGHKPTSYTVADGWPIVSRQYRAYDEVNPLKNQFYHAKETIMRLPLTWAALHLGLASAATYLLISSEVLANAAVFLIH
jgi:hypothetical protein